MKGYGWPGNIRELHNVVERIVVRNQSGDANGLEMGEFVRRCLEGRDVSDSNECGLDLNQTLESIERQIILKVLEEEKYNKTRAAERLGINRSTINRKL